MDDTVEATDEDERQLWSHNLAWLVRLRWVAAFSQAATVLTVRYMGMEFHALRLYTLVALVILSNLACKLWLSRAPRVREWMLAAIMAFDFLLLTALLHASGGPSNPFTVLYLGHIALAAVVLRPRYAWALAAMAIGCFFSLFLLPDGAEDPAAAMHAHAGHASHNAMALHLRGMWVAFAISAAVIAYFVTRVTRDLEVQRSEASLARTRALRSERLASLATLAAGAAHELATPLSTIAVAARELERDLSNLPDASHSADDARLIREEVQRCRHILNQMASDAGESAGEAFREIGADALLAEVARELGDGQARTRVQVETSMRLSLPVRALAQALRGLVRNALQASEGEVLLRAHEGQGGLWIEVQDQGCGIAPELLARVGEPFFTTKEPGKGMGLGVFLARALCERLGGKLEYTSSPGKGTTARVFLPQGAPRNNPLQAHKS